MNLARSAAPSLWRIHLLESWYEFLRVLRTPAFAIPTLVFPVAFYALFALLIGGEWGGIRKEVYLLASYGVFGIIGPALFGFGVGVAIEREQGWLELKRLSPMPTSAYFLAKIVMSLVFAFAVLSLLSLMAIGVGGVRIEPWRLLLLYAVLLAGTLPFCAFGLWIGTVVKGQAAVAVVNLIYLPMSVLSGLRDPDVYPDPDRFDMTREGLPKWNIAFGGGAHRCLGEALARAEMEESIATIARLAPDIRMIGTPPPRGISAIDPGRSTGSRELDPPPSQAVNWRAVARNSSRWCPHMVSAARRLITR